MVEQAHRYRLGHPDVDPFDENQVEHRVANHALQIQARPSAFRDSSVPLFLSDPHGEPDPGVYLAPLRQKRTASISSRVLMAVMAAAAAAVLLTLLSSEATRSDFVNLRASMAAALPSPSIARSSSSLPTQSLRQPSEATQLPARETPTLDAGSVTMAAAAPTREDIKSAYHSALQGGVPQVAPVPESTIPPAPVRHLDPSETASALSRGTALIASGDLAAARLVLRRGADAGDARSAMTLAETYDPAILEKLGVHGVVPDLAKARGWYEKARQFGATEAGQRLELLASKQQ
jgi:TPR repeat protein